jgi:hypothetical protein
MDINFEKQGMYTKKDRHDASFHYFPETVVLDSTPILNATIADEFCGRLTQWESATFTR